MVYVGQTRSRALIATLNGLGWGELTCPGEVPPRRTPWAYDNGAFRAWKAGRQFDAHAFMCGFQAMHYQPPTFIVCPDLVAEGRASLDFSLEWRKRLRGVAQLYLATQDGMTEPEVERALQQFDGIFVGGSLRWKLRTGQAWVALAHRAGKPCHIGRVGTPRRVLWARRIGADSIDSSLPLWSTPQLDSFAASLIETPHPELFGGLNG